MTTSAIDLAAASRVSRRVELRSIHLSEIHGICHAPARGKQLIPSYEQDCLPTKVEGDVIEVTCTYKFKVKSSDALLAEATLGYVVVYKVIGDEEPARDDVEHFARANGAYHTWPFVRESLFSLTSRMGYPPYTLPVLSFMPKPQEKVAADTSTSEASSEESNSTNEGAETRQ